MGILSRLVGAGGTSAIEATGNIVKSVFGDKGEKLSHEQIMAKLAMSPQLAQLEINKVEAGHRSLFVAGARPSLLWVCVSGLAIEFVVSPIIVWFGGQSASLDMSQLMPLVITLLGIGGYRTIEKLGGKAK